MLRDDPAEQFMTERQLLLKECLRVCLAYNPDLPSHETLGFEPFGRAEEYFWGMIENDQDCVIRHVISQLKILDGSIETLFKAISPLEEEVETIWKEGLSIITGMWLACIMLLNDPTLPRVEYANTLILRSVQINTEITIYKRNKNLRIQEEEQFTAVKAKRQRVTRSQESSNLTEIIKTVNRFEPLNREIDTNHNNTHSHTTNDMDTTAAEDQQQNHEGQHDSPPADKENKAAFKPEPFFVKLTANWKATHQKIKDIVEEKVSARMTGDLVKVTTLNERDYRIVQAFLNKEKIEYHVLAPKHERPVKLLVKGLHEHIDLQEIIDELKTVGFNCTNATFLRNKQTKEDMRLLLIQIEPSTGWNDIFRLETLAGMDIFIKKFNHRGIKQCFRCQGYNHSSYGCTLNPKCVKCGKGHHSRDCTKPTSEPAKCCNCGKDHPASYRGCEKNPENWGKARNQPNTRSKPPKPPVDAPLPATPAWQQPKQLFQGQALPPTTSWADRSEPTNTRNPSQTTAIAPSQRNGPNGRRATSGTIPQAPQLTTPPNLSSVGGMGDMFEVLNQLRAVMAHFNVPILLQTLREAAVQLAQVTTQTDKLLILMSAMEKIGQNSQQN